MAGASNLKWLITEIATCPICLEDFKDSKMLHCVHSFCLKCLQGHCKDKVAGDDVACPVCRRRFQIPGTGLEALPHNFFVQNVIEAREASGQKTEKVSLCEVCAVENDEAEDEISPATMYCADCNQKLCKSCSRPHRVWRGGAHRVSPLGSELYVELIQQHGSFCDRHKDERLKLYCHDCEITVCLMCFAADHNGHKCSDVGKAADEFKKLFDSDISSISSRIEELHTVVAQVDSENNKFFSEVARCGSLVQQRGEMVNQITKKQVTQLLHELQTITTDGMKEAGDGLDELKLALTALESFKIYLAELTAKGSSCDIARAAKAMRCRARELLHTYVITCDYRVPRASFTPMNIDELTTGGQNLIGRITIETGNSGMDGSELRLKSTRERELEQQLKQSTEQQQQLQSQLNQLKDDNSRMQEKLDRATDAETNLQQQLKQASAIIDDLIKTKDEYDRTMNNLMTYSRQQEQLQLAAERMKTIEKKMKLAKSKIASCLAMRI